MEGGRVFKIPLFVHSKKPQDGRKEERRRGGVKEWEENRRKHGGPHIIESAL